MQPPFLLLPNLESAIHTRICHLPLCKPKVSYAAHTRGTTLLGTISLHSSKFFSYKSCPLDKNHKDMYF